MPKVEIEIKLTEGVAILYEHPYEVSNSQKLVTLSLQTVGPMFEKEIIDYLELNFRGNDDLTTVILTFTGKCELDTFCNVSKTYTSLKRFLSADLAGGMDEVLNYFWIKYGEYFMP